MGTKIQKLVLALIIASTLASYTQSALASSIKAWGVMAVDSNALVGNFTGTKL
ncbi:MAG: hypothetical protein JW749_01770 [Sedimentisphaerales bacterium]|nr:hypothetical protein [Sedimentisphaerales bacterium]